MSGPVIIGAPSLTPYATFTVGGSGSSDLPASNVKDIEPSKVSRVTIDEPSQSVWNATFFDVVQIDGVAVVNHNARDGQFRVAVTTGTAPVYSTNYAPTSVQASSGFTGSLADYDEDPISADGSHGTFNNDTNELRLRFANPASALKLGNGYQMFSILVQSLADAFPHTVTAQLYENGALKGDLGSRVVSGTDANHYLWWSWDASLLTSASATNIELRLVVTDDLNIGTVSLRLRAVVFRAALATTESGWGYDSGWIDIPAYYSGDIRGVETTPARSLHHYFSDSTPTGNTLRVMIRADNTNSAQEYATEAVGSPSGVVDVGHIVVGGAITNFQYGIKPNTIRTNVGVQQYSGSAMAGQAYSADAFRYREADFTLILTRAERDFLVNNVDWRKGQSSPFYIALEPSLDLAYQQFTAFYCVVSKAGQSEHIPMEFSTTQLFTKSYSLKERL